MERWVSSKEEHDWVNYGRAWEKNLLHAVLMGKKSC